MMAKPHPPSEWHITHQWNQVGIRYCRHFCDFDSDTGEWNFQDEHTLGLFLSPRPFRFSHRHNQQQHTGFHGKGDLLITPANTTMFTQAKGDVHIAQIRLKSSFLQHVAEETLGHNSRVELIQALQAHDPQIESIVMMLVRELQQPSLGGQLYVDSLANVLAVHLLRHHATIKPTLATYRGGLSQSQLSQVLDHIDAHLGDDIQLNDLAQLVDISQFHFGRLFKQSIGHTPYQYLLQQRIERAKQLLKQTDAPIIDIAFDCGFSSHSHLSKQFRQSTGVTPKTYRAS